jgi:hypothetical protein
MKKLLLASAALLCLGLNSAFAGNYTIPQWQSTSPTSTGANCVPSGSSLGIPIPAGTVIFVCSVAPITWVPGTASSNESNLAIGGYTSGAGTAASTFTLVTVAPVTTIQTFAANTGVILP